MWHMKHDVKKEQPRVVEATTYCSRVATGTWGFFQSWFLTVALVEQHSFSAQSGFE